MLHWEPWGSHYSTGQWKTKKVTENCLPLLSFLFVPSHAEMGFMVCLVLHQEGFELLLVSLALAEVVSCQGSGNPCAGKLLPFLVAKIKVILAGCGDTHS